MILKGVLDLCKAIPLILKKHPDTKFIFVGTALNSPLNEVSMDNYMRSELKNNLQNIVFTGMVSLDKIPILLKQADALIIPSLWENFATVCLEAMSAGKLVIGTKTGGIPEIIGKDCGLLAKYKNYKNLAKKINYAIENPQKMQILAKNGRNKIINSYSQQKISLKMEEIYLSNLNS